MPAFSFECQRSCVNVAATTTLKGDSMFSFLTDGSYWLWVGPFMACVFAECFFTWSQPVLNRHPNALFWNNLFVLSIIALLVVIFVKTGLVPGLTALALGVVAYGIGMRIVQKAILGSIINRAEERKK